MGKSMISMTSEIDSAERKKLQNEKQNSEMRAKSKFNGEDDLDQDDQDKDEEEVKPI